MMYAVFLATAVLLVTFTLLPLWRCDAWWVRSFDFPRLQLTLASLFMLAAETLLFDYTQITAWVLTISTLLCFFYQSWWIMPYTPLFPTEVKTAVIGKTESSGKTETSDIEKPVSGRMIRIMTANVLTPNRNAEALIKRVRENQPDILVTLESDHWWQSQLDVLEPDYPYTIKCPLDNLYGMHVYSRLRFIDSRIDYLVAPDIPSMQTVAVLRSGHKVQLHFLHPTPPVPSENDSSSERDAELIIAAKKVARTGSPVIVTGDLNDVAWSETTRLFRKISGLLDPRVGRGMFNTFHAGWWFIRWPLDHLFHSAHFTLSDMRRLKPFGSDHFAIFTELLLESESCQTLNENGLEADEDDIAWAESKLKSLGVEDTKIP